VKRAECIGMLYPELDDKVVVTIMGACAQELYDLGHKENFFYLQHAMGLASSIGLGLALHLPHEQIVVLDGDGSVLMNLGTLATLARYRPRNLVHFIFDNGSLLSTGGFDSHTTSGITDLAAIARGAGIEHVAAGLRLTFAQACRLWQVDVSTCEMLLDQLVQDGFLCKTDSGVYIAAATSP